MCAWIVVGEKRVSVCVYVNKRRVLDNRQSILHMYSDLVVSKFCDRVNINVRSLDVFFREFR